MGRLTLVVPNWPRARLLGGRGGRSDGLPLCRAMVLQCHPGPLLWGKPLFLLTVASLEFQDSFGLAGPLVWPPIVL